MWRAVGLQIPLSVAPGRVFGLRSPWLLGSVCRAGRFSPRFSYFHEPNPGFLGRIEKARLRRWALCALPTPRSQAGRAIHRTSLKAAVRASALVCATSRGCRWVVSSAHPAREAAGPWLLCPVSHRTHGTWLVPAALISARTCTRIHTGPLGTAGLVLFVASWRFARAPPSHAPRLLAPADPRFAHRTFPTHPACSMIIASAACAFPGLPLVRFAHDATYRHRSRFEPHRGQMAFAVGCGQ